MQVLTEEQQDFRQEVLLSILDNFINENYEVDEDYIMTEEDAYITSIVMDYFEENFKFPTLEESVLESVTGYDINEKLYVELYDILMDESIGRFIAGAAHGIRNAISGLSAKAAASSKERAKEKHQSNLVNPDARRPITKADAAEKSYTAAKASGTAGGAFKQSFQKGRIDGAKQKAEKAKESWKAAETRRKSTWAKHELNKRDTSRLAKKIDTGVDNIKRKAHNAVSAGAQRVSGILGKAAEKAGGVVGRVVGI